MFLRTRARRSLFVAVLAVLVIVPLWYVLVCRGFGERDFVEEFERTFPLLHVSVQNPIGYTGGGITTQWRAPVWSRYVVVMEAQCMVGGCCPERHKFPLILVNEISAIELLSGGSAKITYGDSRTLTPAEWDVLRASQGDVSSVLPGARRDAPVPGFEGHWRR